jgi:hypothetical protein
MAKRLSYMLLQATATLQAVTASILPQRLLTSIASAAADDTPLPLVIWHGLGDK